MHTKRLSEDLVPLRNSQPGRGVPYSIYRIDIRARTQQHFDDFVGIKFATIEKNGQHDDRLRAAYRRSGSAPADSRSRAIEGGFERNPDQRAAASSDTGGTCAEGKLQSTSRLEPR